MLRKAAFGWSILPVLLASTTESARTERGSGGRGSGKRGCGERGSGLLTACEKSARSTANNRDQTQFRFEAIEKSSTELFFDKRSGDRFPVLLASTTESARTERGSRERGSGKRGCGERGSGERGSGLLSACEKTARSTANNRDQTQFRFVAIGESSTTSIYA